jgi:hypothetical protein
MGFVAFDLEIAKQIPSKYVLTNTLTRQRAHNLYDTREEAEHQKSQAIDAAAWRVDSVPDDFMAHWPLGISVAATSLPSSEKTVPWYSSDEYSKPLPQVTKKTAKTMVELMCDLSSRGHQVVTWNGLRFDFHVLAHESGMWDECIELAKNHVDLMFLIFCHKGYYAKLDNCAKVMLGESKTEGIDGAHAPELWARGEYDLCIEYVCQDVALTAKLAQFISDTSMIEWTASSSGKLHSILLRNLIRGGRLPTVMECLDIPEPDTSWMSNPPHRSDFFEWMDEESPFIPF